VKIFLINVKENNIRLLFHFSQNITYLISTMTQRRLNYFIILHIHKEKLNLLDLKKIFSEFISEKQNRKNFFDYE